MELKVYVERLKEGSQETFEGTVSSDFMPKEAELFFEDEIKVSGSAYIAGDHLILDLQAQTAAFMPCSICNKPTKISLTLSDLSHAEPLEEIKSSAFDFSEVLRTDLLLQLPNFAECEGGCKERAHMKKHLEPELLKSSNHHFPFSSL